jgi:hypothetical protein
VWLGTSSQSEQALGSFLSKIVWRIIKNGKSVFNFQVAAMYRVRKKIKPTDTFLKLSFKEKLAITEMCKRKTTQFQTKSSGFGGCGFACRPAEWPIP